MAIAVDLRPVSEDDLRKCNLFRCFCCWRRRCSLGIPRIGPRSEYLRLPAGADEGPMLMRDLGCSSATHRMDLCWGEEEENKEEGGGREEEQQLLEVDKEEEEDSATTDGRSLWSVLVGCTSADHPSHDLRLHYFRVTASGRVIGHNNDLLELF